MWLCGGHGLLLGSWPGSWCVGRLIGLRPGLPFVELLLQRIGITADFLREFYSSSSLALFYHHSVFTSPREPSLFCSALRVLFVCVYLAVLSLTCRRYSTWVSCRRDGSCEKGRLWCCFFEIHQLVTITIQSDSSSQHNEI